MLFYSSSFCGTKDSNGRGAYAPLPWLGWLVSFSVENGIEICAVGFIGSAVGKCKIVPAVLNSSRESVADLQLPEFR